jgi:hypothetical protein
LARESGISREDIGTYVIDLTMGEPPDCQPNTRFTDKHSAAIRD